MDTASVSSSRETRQSVRQCCRLSRQSVEQSAYSRTSSVQFVRPASRKSAKSRRSPGAASPDLLKRTLITELSSKNDDESDEEDRAVSVATPQFEDLDDDDVEEEEEEVDIYDDTGYDTDVEVDMRLMLYGDQTYDPTGRKDYVERCDDLGVIPVSFFMKHIEDENLVMRFHGLGPVGAQALANTFEDNFKLKKLDLEGNGIEPEGAVHIARALRENDTLVELHLAENDIGSPGAEEICQTFKDNTTLVKLNLSGNSFGDSDAKLFNEMLQNNITIKHIILRNNNFGEGAAPWFRDTLAHNESVELIDLSWNHFRTKGAIELCLGLKENIGLKYLYLEMNGFGLEGAEAMGDALKHNRCLLELDLTANRIPAAGADALAKGFAINDYLQILKIGKNPLAYTGALSMLQCIDSNDMSAIELLDLSGITVNEAFLDLQKKMASENRQVEVIYEGVMTSLAATYVLDEFDSTFQRDPMKLLRDYVDKEGYRLIDLFMQFDKNNDFKLSFSELRGGIKRVGIKMSESQIKQLMTFLDKDNDGVVEFGEMMEGYKQYRTMRRKVKRANQETLEEIENLKEKDPNATPMFISKHINNYDGEAHKEFNELGEFSAKDIAKK